jgi:arsenate reductase
MAEGWTRHLKGGQIAAYSAGLEAHGLNRVAVRVMAERGVDISHYRSKRIEVLRNVTFECVVTVCDRSRARCPVFPEGTRLIHVAIEDPTLLSRTATSEEEALEHYRRVCEQIRVLVETLPQRILELGSQSRS